VRLAFLKNLMIIQSKSLEDRSHPSFS